MAEPASSQIAIRVARSAMVDRLIFGAMALVVVSSAVATKRFSGAPALAVIERPATSTLPTEPVSAPESAPEPDPADDPFDALRTSIASASPASAADAADALEDGVVRYYDGRPIRPVKRLWMTVTAYSPDARSCGKWADGKTASMKSVWTNGGCLVAADTKVLPLGSLVSVPGYAGDMVVPVLDRGGKIKGPRLDVLYPTHTVAMSWGVQRLPVTVWEFADE